MIEISNEHLRLSLTEQGAEMTSLIDLRDQREILWQGDAELWNGTSPILFPNVGRYWQGRYRHGGKEYEQGAHGFVRHRLWTLESQEAQRATFSYTSTADDLALYPFPFRLTVTYALEEKRITVDFTVENIGEETMFFQLGAHPGFNVHTYADTPDDFGYLRIEGNPDHLLRAGEGGCLESESYPIPVNEEGFIPVTVDTFLNEALIFEDHQAHFVTLFDSLRRPLVAVTCPSPVTLIWAPQGKKAPFVCVEPWYGQPDAIGFAGKLSERALMQTAAAGESWTGGYSFFVF